MLRFVHRGVVGRDTTEGWGDEYLAQAGAGWDTYLHTLVQYLTHFSGRTAVYVEAEAPASGATSTTWDRLRAAVADPVLIELDGVAPIVGVVGLDVPGFLGVRTADALVRFHHHGALGMPIAVAEHCFSDIDVIERAKAWETWLASGGDAR